MNSQDQRNVAKAIAGAFLVSCLTGGVAATVANAQSMTNTPTTSKPSSTNAQEGMMRHGCSGKPYTKNRSSGMMSHGCSGNTKTHKPTT